MGTLGPFRAQRVVAGVGVPASPVHVEGTGTGTGLNAKEHVVRVDGLTGAAG